MKSYNLLITLGFQCFQWRSWKSKISSCKLLTATCNFFIIFTFKAHSYCWLQSLILVDALVHLPVAFPRSGPEDGWDHQGSPETVGGGPPLFGDDCWWPGEGDETLFNICWYSSCWSHSSIWTNDDMWHVCKLVEICKIADIKSIVYYVYWVSYVSSLQYSTAIILYCPNEASLLTKSSTKMDHHSTSEESPSVQCRWKRKKSAAVGVGRHMPRHPTDLPVTLKWYQDTTILQIWCTSQHL